MGSAVRRKLASTPSSGAALDPAERIRGWWRATEESLTGRARPRKHLQPPSVAKKMEEDVPLTVATWPGPRIAIIQALFGPGYVSPGGDAAASDLFAEANLGPKSQVLHLGSGIGGIDRLIYIKTGASVQAYDESRWRTREARAQAKAAGMSEKLKFHRCRLADFVLPKRKSDLVISKEALHGIEEKAALYARIATALKPGGQVVITDYQLGGRRLMRPYLAAWFRVEPRPIYLWDLARSVRVMQEAGLILAAAIDITGEHHRKAVAAFTNCAAVVKRPGIKEPWRRWFLSEGNYWGPRLGALDAGDVKLYRFRLFKKK